MGAPHPILPHPITLNPKVLTPVLEATVADPSGFPVREIGSLLALLSLLSLILGCHYSEETVYHNNVEILM